MKPQDYGLPHSSFRTHQEDSINWCFGVETTGIAEAPTGSGKTSFPAAMGSQQSVIALCRTKNLQATNYGQTYGFNVLFGKANYECIHPDAKIGTTCADCKFDDKPSKCPVFGRCRYHSQKRLCQGSTKVSLNYSYYMVAQWPKLSPPSVLFLDEAHELHEQVTAFAGCTITDKQRVDWGLPQFPELKPKSDSGMLIKATDPLPEAVYWLEKARDSLRNEWKALDRKTSDNAKTRKRKCELLGKKLAATIDALRICPDDWYISSGKKAQKYRREYRPAFVCKPLTARHHAPGYFGFGNGGRQILMSATIGDFDSFKAELGIRESADLVVPNQYPPEARPVYLLDCPSMGSRATDGDFERQADLIASSVLGCPNHWSGLILVTRKSEANLLAKRLGQRGLADRVWVTPGWDGEYKPTDQQVIAWEKRKKRVANSICISWSLWVGYDGLDERILVAAKVPYPTWGSKGSFDGAWRAYDMKRYRWATANMLAQGLGRTRRGRDCDYDLRGEFNGFVAVADGSYRQIKKYLPGAIRDALVE